MALFALLIEAGSFTEAAKRFDLPKSRVSQRIQSLEEHLSIRLLNRTTRRLSLTSAGEKYLVYCKQMLSVGTEADDLIQMLTARPAGKLRIIAPAGLMMSSLLKWNQLFLKANPDVTLEILTADSFFESIEGAFDVAFRIGKPVEQSYIGRLLGEYERLLVAAPEYIQNNPVLTVDDLAKREILTHKTWKHLRLYREDEKVMFQDASRLITDNLPYLLTCTLQGSGIAILPRYLIQDHLQNNELEIILPDWQVENIDIWLVYPSNKNNSPMLNSYVNFILSQNRNPDV